MVSDKNSGAEGRCPRASWMKERRNYLTLPMLLEVGFNMSEAGKVGEQERKRSDALLALLAELAHG